MLSWVTRWRALGVGASCLIHLAMIAGILFAERLIFPADAFRLPVLLAEVVTMDAPPQTEPVPRKPAQKPASGWLPRLSKPVHTPVQTPLPQASDTTIQPAEPQPQASTSAPTGASMTTVGEPASSPGPVAASPSVVASIPSRDAGATGAITRLARPHGGYQVRPTYPPSVLRQGIQGTTLLKVHVLIDGRVGEVVVQQSAGHPDLDLAAAEAVRRWRFEPARRGDEPVAMWVLLPVEFQIR
jgi:periplasmic protein TonB